MRILPIITAIAASRSCLSPAARPPRRRASPWSVPSTFSAIWVPGSKSPALTTPFESGLEKVTIAWHPRDDGGLDVVNKGYNPDRGMWQKTDGVAYPHRGAQPRRAGDFLLRPFLRQL